MPANSAPRKKAANAQPAASSKKTNSAKKKAAPKKAHSKKAQSKKAQSKQGVSTRVQPKQLVVPKVTKRSLAEELNPKSSVKKRSVNHAGVNKSRAPGSPGAEPLSNQDPKRRLGNFVGKGEPPRKGYRGTGIIGQQKKPNRQN